MIPAIAAGLISGGAGLIGDIFNIGQQQSNNELQKEMMYTQRQWALDDWNRNNAYNSPSAQMQRYKDANLNPHLIYGQSNTAAPVRSTDTAKTQAPQTNIQATVNSMLSGYMSMYDLEKTRAETDRLQKQAELLEAQRRLTDANTTGKGYANTIAGGTLDYQMDYIKGRNKIQAADLQKKGVDTQFTINQDARNTLLTANTLQLGVQKALSMEADRAYQGVQKLYLQQQIRNLEKDGVLKQLDIKLRQLGIQPGDPAWLRVGTQIIQDPAKAWKILEDLGDKISPDIMRPLTATPGSWQNKK